jgi:mRNA interferase RelE/StbE
MKTIVLQPSAARSLDKIAEPFRSKIADELAAYALGKPCDTKAMKGLPTVRLRIGDYRVIFDEDQTTISVLAVGHRREIYR